METSHPLSSRTGVTIHRAELSEREAAFSIVEEYNQSVGVVVRDSAESFATQYFGAGRGVWLASSKMQVIGCIALRALASPEAAGEIKRLYLRPQFRGQGIADALLTELESYAAQYGYRWLYLDSKDDLQTAIRFYYRRGYEACERYNNNPQATIFLRKQIGGRRLGSAQQEPSTLRTAADDGQDAYTSRPTTPQL